MFKIREPQNIWTLLNITYLREDLCFQGKLFGKIDENKDFPECFQKKTFSFVASFKAFNTFKLKVG